ncbi:DUF92 domain-containing protein [Paenibacillus sp. CAA11]|uniref:DUF92 domain-containing protein n=1 Tax=Paenibacillus sp. CAA11 TaxID=1532905 RepID=UPI003FA372D2
MSWLFGAAGAILVAGAAYWKKSLSLSGALAAVMMGTIYYGAGNLFWFGLLLLFFVTSTLLSKWRGDRKEELEKSYAKSSTRDAGQVFANGGVGMLACLGCWIWPSELWAYGFVGVMATVTADTWATEWGGLSRRPPRSVLTWRPLPPGTSGGVSLLGTAAAAAGGLLIGGAGWLLGTWTAVVSGSATLWLLVGGIGGLAGAMADSLLGASVQRMYRCQVCGKLVEVQTHCDHPTVFYRGMNWMNNDAVNLISSLAGGGIGIWIGSIAG